MSSKLPGPAKKASHSFEVRRIGPVSYLRLIGVIDETFDPTALMPSMLGHVLIDLGRVERISSFGVRRWMELTRSLPIGAFGMYLMHAPPVLVDQLNMVEGFAGICKVLSLLAPYACDSCHEERVRVVDVRASSKTLAEGLAPPHVCSVCGSQMRFADVPTDFFDFVRFHPLDFLEPVVEKFLASLRPASVMSPSGYIKIVQNDLTFIRMGTTIKGDLSVRKLAGGLEGRVVYDFAGVAAVEPVGGARLAEVLTEASKTARVFLWRVPPIVLDVLSKRLVRPKMGVATLYLPCECLTCGSGLPVQIEAEKYARELLTAGTMGSRPCAVCGGSTRAPKLDAILPMLTACPARDAPFAEVDAIEPRALSQVLHGTSAHEQTPQPGSEPEVPSTEGGQLQILKRIGEGGMAEVFLARQAGFKGIEKYVVVKKILPQFARSKDFVDMLFAEARANARLTHPNVVQIFDVGVADGLAYLTMEYVRGPDLKRIIVMLRKAGMLMPVTYAMRIVAETAAGLHYAHTFVDPMGAPHPVIHRDVSPHNVLVSLDGAVKLSDFGIAKVNEGGEHTRPGMFKGKISYSSPEAARGLPLDGRHDIFSLGIVLFEALTGHAPFRGENDTATLTAIIDQPTPDPRQVNPGLPEDAVQVVFKALAKNPDERFQTAGEMREALETVMHRAGYRSSPADVAGFLTQLLGDQLREYAPSGGVGVTLSRPNAATPAPGGRVSATPGGHHGAGTPSPRPSGTPRPGTPAPRPSVGSGLAPGARPGSKPGTPPPGPRPGTPPPVGAKSGTPPPGTSGPRTAPSGQTPQPRPSIGGGLTGRSGGTPPPAASAPRSGGTPRPRPLGVVTGTLLDEAGGPHASSTANPAVDAAPETLPGRPTGLIAAGAAAVLLLVATGAYFALRSTEKRVEVLNLGPGEQLYVGGVRVDAMHVPPSTAGKVVVAVAAGGKLKRLGTSQLADELDVLSLFEANVTTDQKAGLSVTSQPAGCAVVLGGSSTPTPTPATASIPAGKEVQLDVKCPGKPTWTRWLLGGPGQAIEVTVN